MLTVSIKDKALRELLKKMKQKSMNMKPLFTVMVGQLKFEIEQNFRMQGSYGDVLLGRPTSQFKRWKALSSLSVAHKAATGKPTKILMGTNRLRASIGTVRNITKNSLTYGTNLEYAGVHHFGAIIRPKRTRYLAIPYPGITGRPRQYQNTFFAKRSLFQSLGGGEYRPLFMLKSSVEISARPFITIGKKRIDVLAGLSADFLLGKTILGKR